MQLEKKISLNWKKFPVGVKLGKKYLGLILTLKTPGIMGSVFVLKKWSLPFLNWTKKLIKYLNTSNGFYFYNEIVVFQKIKGSNYIDIREI